MPREEIVGALARGYCTKENENKVLDPTLIEAMANEVEKVLEDALKRAGGLKERFKVVLESLVDMVNQHCQSKVADNKDFYVDHACLSANEDAFYVLEQLGLLKMVNGREGILSFDTDSAIHALYNQKDT